VCNLVMLLFFLTVLPDLTAQDPCSPSFPSLGNITTPMVFTGQTLKVPNNTTVTFSANVTMAGCTLVIGSNSFIKVQNSTFTLSMNGSTRSVIRGCVNMWQSIELNSGAIINLSNSDIRHGSTAFNFKTGSNPGASSVVGCNFDANVICFKASNFSNFIGVFTGNKMVGIQPANNGITMLPPMSLGFSSPKAFDLTTVSGTLGAENATKNTISGMSKGITQVAGSVVLNNFEFKNNEPIHTGIDISTGGTIRLSKSCSFVGTNTNTIGVNSLSSTVVTSSSFKNYQSGIQAAKSNVALWGDCVFSGNGNGIDVTKTSVFAFPISATSINNSFSANKNGLKSDQSIIVLSGYTFLNNTTTGINAVMSDLSIVPSFFPGYPSGIANIFTNNKTGILSAQSRKVVIKGNTFTNQVDLDIDINTSTDPQYNVEISTKNTFNLDAPKKGSIAVQRAVNSGDVMRTYIFDNDFLMPGTGIRSLLTDISLLSITALPGAVDKASISLNRISCQYGNGPMGLLLAKGIDAINIAGDADGYEVNYNTINFVLDGLVPNDKVTGVGIRMTGVTGSNVSVTGNIITSSHYPTAVDLRRSWIRCGTHITNCPHVKMCDNSITNTDHEFHFIDDDADVEFGRNIMGSGGIGFLNWGMLPTDRHHRKNTWVGTYSRRSAENTGTLVEWFVDNTAPNGQPSFFPPPSTSTPPTLPDIFMIAEETGTNTSTCPPNFTEKPPIKKLTKDFVEGKYDSATKANSWDFERNLLGKMQKYPLEFANDAISQNYYNSKLNTVVWQLAKGDKMLNECSFASTVNQANLEDIQQKIEILKADLLAIQKTETSNPTVINSTWQANKTEKINQLNFRANQIDSIGKLILNERLIAGFTIQAHLANIVASNLLEQNYLTLLSLLSKRLTGETWIAKDSLALRSLANSCSIEGGIAVSLARELLPQEEAIVFLREQGDPYCNKPKSEGRSIEQSELSQITLWPNPAKDHLLVGFPSASTGSISIFNTAGVVLKTLDFSESKEIEIPLHGFSNGIYILKTEEQNRKISFTKFVVLH
jgi:hypothetical protein